VGISPVKTAAGGVMKSKMMAVSRRRCQHNARQFDTRCNFLPNIAGLDALCFVGLAIRLHMC
jgi:hypothetical protein